MSFGLPLKIHGIPIIMWFKSNTNVIILATERFQKILRASTFNIFIHKWFKNIWAHSGDIIGNCNIQVQQPQHAAGRVGDAGRKHLLAARPAGTRSLFCLQKKESIIIQARDFWFTTGVAIPGHWIGMQKTGGAQFTQWMDGRPLQFTDWDNGIPRVTSNRHCVVL
jgi:hypothetical protein